MTFLYFACTECKSFTEVGSRWAAWSLEANAVTKRGEQVSVEAVFSAEQYWNPPKVEKSDWLYKEVLPSVQTFLENHKEHRIVFGSQDEAVARTDDEMFD
jgi:hypothetical protein